MSWLHTCNDFDACVNGDILKLMDEIIYLPNVSFDLDLQEQIFVHVLYEDAIQRRFRLGVPEYLQKCSALRGWLYLQYSVHSGQNG